MGERAGLSAWSSIIGTWVSIFGVAGGGYMGLQTYEEEVAKMEDARVVQTFALYDMFNSAERLSARQSVFNHMQNDGELIANDVYIIADFYDALQICVDRNLCDADLSVRLFQSYAVPIWDSLGESLIGARTESDPHFGGGLEWMAGLPLPDGDGAASADSAVIEPSETATEAALEEPPATSQAVPSEPALPPAEPATDAP